MQAMQAHVVAELKSSVDQLVMLLCCLLLLSDKAQAKIVCLASCATALQQHILSRVLTAADGLQHV